MLLIAEIGELSHREPLFNGCVVALYFRGCLVFPEDLGDCMECLLLIFPGNSQKDDIFETQMAAKLLAIFFEKLIILKLLQCNFNNSWSIDSCSAIEPVFNLIDVIIIKEIYCCKLHCLELV